MHPSRLKRAALQLCFCAMAAPLLSQSATAPNWVEAWSAAPDSAGPSLEAQTLRQILRSSVGGSSVRIRLSNRFGAGPITLGPVRLALHASGSAIQPGSDHALSFSGKPTVTIPKGGSALSDSLAMDLAALQELALSIYVPTRMGPSTMHSVGMEPPT
jgi:hypothetical protein